MHSQVRLLCLFCNWIQNLAVFVVKFRESNDISRVTELNITENESYFESVNLIPECNYLYD